MESLFVRYRNVVVLLAVLMAQVVGLAVQVRRADTGHNSLEASDGNGVRLIRYWAESIVSPPQRLIHGIRLGVSGIWSGYIGLWRVQRQNQELQKTIDRLRLEQAQLLEDARQGQRLQAMLGFQQHYIYATVPAQVFGSSGTDQSKIFYIDKGSDAGLKRDMPVISAEGIVGKLRDVFPHTAQVLVINDQTSGAGVILESTRIRGILRGNAAGQLEIVGLMADQRIKAGEKVLTAGGDMIFPRGLPVGTVQKIVPDPDRDSFINVMVTPAANLNRLDEVLVITSTEPRFPAQAQMDVATSEAEKGAEAAQIQEQLKASQIMAERLPSLNDPNAPKGATTPANGQANPQQPGASTAAGQAAPVQAPGPKLLPTMHPDRFSPGGAAPSDSVQQPKAIAPAGAANRPPSIESKPPQATKPATPPQPAANGAGRTQ